MERLIAALLLTLAAFSPTLAQEEGASEMGDFASAVAPGRPLATPPGIYAQIAARANDFLTGTSPSPHRALMADEVKALLDLAAQGGPAVFVLDIRPKAKFDAGHIAGAVNIPFETVARPESLAKLPVDGTKIVIVCNTGHTASQTNAILALLGYNAWVLKFGWMGWAATTKVAVGSAAGPTSLVIGAGYAAVK